MRADAKKNYDHLLVIARDVITKQGVDASLRDIARKAGVGMGTLYRHFPTREDLLEALLRTRFDELTELARGYANNDKPDAMLIAWLHDIVAVTQNYSGVIAVMVAAIAAPDSALHASCVAMRAAGTQLLTNAQQVGLARKDIDGTDLFALISALGWLGDQPALAPRAEHLFGVIAGAILTNPASIDALVKTLPPSSITPQDRNEATPET
ncbi:TetR/AcrR family transcriptional regulator [Thalassospira marina]|uniref:TetR family transcriptional regulator n=1 Tax=Thalassospira marina TaxID=2048283 RepID=A0ABN5FNT5_9PROT|nr:TetR/AcrR family transcriptional regulator [Thalassospira marina]AUG54154.1 TetR family transcriptional regulator [Thalassospira marina]